MRYVLFALMLVCGTAFAAPGDYSLVLHGVSWHSIPRPKDPKWNETNPGLALRYEYTDTVALQGGFYKNSYYKQSVYGGVEWTPLKLGVPMIGGEAQFGGFLGLASGYTDKVGGLAGGLIRWQGRKMSVSMRVVPAKMAIITLEVGYRF